MSLDQNKTYNARRERFLKAKKRRLDKATETLETLRKLSIKSNHAYTEGDVEEIISKLTEEFYKVIHSFSISKTKTLNYYLEAEKQHYSYLSENDPELYSLITSQVPHIENLVENNPISKKDLDSLTKNLMERMKTQNTKLEELQRMLKEKYE
jgi:hypothetical protein